MSAGVEVELYRPPAARRAPSPRYQFYAREWVHRRLVREAVTFELHRGEDDVAALEAAFAAFVGLPHAVAVPMCRVGLFAIFRHYAGGGRDVLLSPYTVCDVVNMVLAAGARPVFVDVEPHTCAMDPDALRRRIGPRAAMVLATHLHGVCAPIEALAHVAAAHGLPLVEDAAQALGGQTAGRRVGAFGEASAFSFGAFKNVNTAFGGMVATRDAALAAAVRGFLAPLPWFRTRSLLRKVAQSITAGALADPLWYGLGLFRLMRWGMLHDVEWVNRLSRIELDTARRASLPAYYRGRYTPGQARAALRQLPRVDADGDQRIGLASRYAAGLAGLPGLPPPPDGRRHGYTYYPLRVARRAALVKWLMHHGRDVAAQHLWDCSGLPAFAEGGACATAAALAPTVLLLPTWPGYGEDEVDRNVAVIRAWYAAGEPDYTPGGRAS